MYYYSGSNNSTYMIGSRRAKTLQTATRKALDYLRGELMREGRVHIFAQEDQPPILTFERSIHTGYRCIRTNDKGEQRTVKL